MSQDAYLRLKAALEARRPVPDEVVDWLMRGFDDFEQGQRLDRALGLHANSGDAWRHPVRQVRRAEMERLYLHAADALDGRTDKSARIISNALTRLDATTLDGLPEGAKHGVFNLCLGYGVDKVPRSRSSIMRILEGDTQAQRDGLA